MPPWNRFLIAVWMSQSLHYSLYISENSPSPVYLLLTSPTDVTRSDFALTVVRAADLKPTGFNQQYLLLLPAFSLLSRVSLLSSDYVDHQTEVWACLPFTDLAEATQFVFLPRLRQLEHDLFHNHGIIPRSAFCACIVHSDNFCPRLKCTICGVWEWRKEGWTYTCWAPNQGDREGNEGLKESVNQRERRKYPFYRKGLAIEAYITQVTKERREDDDSETSCISSGRSACEERGSGSGLAREADGDDWESLLVVERRRKE